MPVDGVDLRIEGFMGNKTENIANKIRGGLSLDSGERIAVFGDWHGNSAWAERALRSAAAAGITTFIHVGDHGMYWPPSDGTYDPLFDGPVPPLGLYSELNIALVAELGLTGYIVDGNHDNHTALRSLAVDDEGFGVISPGLRYARRGVRTTFGGRTFGFLGGAFSIDYQQRIQDVSVWIDKEQVTPADVAALGAEPLDVLITHDVPEGTEVYKMFALPQSLEDLSLVSQKLVKQAVDRTGPSVVFSGHWHQRRSHPLNRRTMVEILDREGRSGNAVVLDTKTLTVAPLPVD